MSPLDAVVTLATLATDSVGTGVISSSGCRLSLPVAFSNAPKLAIN